MVILAAVPPPRPPSPTLIQPPQLIGLRSGSTTNATQTTDAAATASLHSHFENGHDVQIVLHHPPSRAKAAAAAARDYAMVSFSQTLSDDMESTINGDADDDIVLQQSPSYGTTDFGGCLYYHCGWACCDAIPASPPTTKRVTAIPSPPTITSATTTSGASSADATDAATDTATVTTASLSPTFSSPPSSPRSQRPAGSNPDLSPTSSCRRRRSRFESHSPTFTTPLRNHSIEEKFLQAPPRCPPVPSLANDMEDDMDYEADDPIMRARHKADDPAKRHVRFDTSVDVHEFEAVPPNEQAALFWSDDESYELRHERKALLSSLKQHVLYAPLIPWREAHESIRGLEDHYADWVGRTSSYYVRKRHEDLILREYQRHRYGAHLADKLGRISTESSEDDKERALEMAALDSYMAADASEAPQSPLVPTTGEAFLHTLLLRLRDFS